MDEKVFTFIKRFSLQIEQSATSYFEQKVRVFIFGKLLQPSLIFVSKG